MGPAFSKKAGSVGKIQERCCHGLSASSASQRAIVEAEASLTPRSTTSRCSSAREKRDKGRPCSRGSPQAIAFTRVTSSGGKTTRPARALAIFEPGQPLLKEPFPPAPDHLGRRLQPPRDLGVALPVGCVEDQL